MKTPRRSSGAGFLFEPLFCHFAVLSLVGLVLASCSSTPKYPAYPEPTTTVLSASYENAFKSVLEVLRHDDRLELHTIDKAGRFLAREKTSGFIFFRHRTVLEIELKPENADTTRLSMKLTAEKYDTGGLTREAGWYPSRQVDTVLGEDVLRLIEEGIAQSHS